MISIYSKDWKSSRFQSKAIKTSQEEDLGRELLVKTVTRPSVRETANRSKINPTKPALKVKLCQMYIFTRQLTQNIT